MNLLFLYCNILSRDLMTIFSLIFQERTHQRDLRFLQERLDQLDSSQRAQMEELKGFAASTPAPKRTTFLDQDIDRERESASW